MSEEVSPEAKPQPFAVSSSVPLSGGMAESMRRANEAFVAPNPMLELQRNAAAALAPQMAHFADAARLAVESSRLMAGLDDSLRHALRPWQESMRLAVKAARFTSGIDAALREMVRPIQHAADLWRDSFSGLRLPLLQLQGLTDTLRPQVLAAVAFQNQISASLLPYADFARSIAPLVADAARVQENFRQAFAFPALDLLRADLQRTSQLAQQALAGLRFPEVTLPEEFLSAVRGLKHLSDEDWEALLAEEAESLGEESAGDTQLSQEVSAALEEFFASYPQELPAAPTEMESLRGEVALLTRRLEVLSELVAKLVARKRSVVAVIVLGVILPYLVGGPVSGILGNLLTPHVQERLGIQSSEPPNQALKTLEQLSRCLPNVRVVASESAAIRDRKRRDGRVTATVRRGQFVLVLGESRRWLHVEGRDTATGEAFRGWLRKGDLAPVQESSRKAKHGKGLEDAEREPTQEERGAPTSATGSGEQ